MVSFYPGPSRIYDEIPSYVKDAAKAGILSMNHRSEEFVSMSKKTISLLKQRLGVPKNYMVFFTSSATESWEIIAQSVVTQKSYHFFNGSFGQKWYEYTRKLQREAEAFPFSREEALVPQAFNGERAVICVTQNETSNGTQVSNAVLKKLRLLNPKHLIAVDATSSLAGIVLDFKQADIWYASVQKCFGLPAGMAVMICSPTCMAHVTSVNEMNHYNSLTFMAAMMNKWQTPYTPNVLGIYLLMRVLEKMKPIREVHASLVKRYHDWVEFFSDRKTVHHLIKNKTVHSFTIIPVETSVEANQRIKSIAKKKGFLLGEGYGDLKSTTFRIANFPALKNSEIQSLKKILKTTAL